MKHSLKSTTVVLSASLAIFGATAASMAQGTRSSGGSSNPLLDIAAGLDPVTGQQASVPFTAPTTLGGGFGALPPLVSTTNAQPIFISDSELANAVPAASGFANPGFVTGGAGFNVIDTGSGATQVFVSDTELGSFQAAETGFGTGLTTGFPTNAAVGSFASTDAIVGRLPGDLPIVGPEFTQELPGVGLSVVSPIPTVSSFEAVTIAADIASGTVTFSSGIGSGNLGSVPSGLPSPVSRPTGDRPYISGNLAAVRLGIGEPASNNPIAQPNPVSNVTPTSSTENVNAPINAGQPQSFTTVRVEQAAPAPTPAADPAPAPATTTAPQVVDATPSAPAASGACTGPLVIQFDDDSTSLSESQKQRLRSLVVACRTSNPDVVYRAVGYPDSALGNDASARRIPGARLFDLRFFMVESGISAQDLDLSTDDQSGDINNALVVFVD